MHKPYILSAMPLHMRNLIWHSACTFRYTELHVNRLEKFKADMLTLHFEMEAETTAIKEALEEMRAEDTETAIEYTNDFLMVCDLRLRAYNSDIIQLSSSKPHPGAQECPRQGREYARRWESKR